MLLKGYRKHEKGGVFLKRLYGIMMILLFIVVGCSKTDTPVGKNEAEKEETTESTDSMNETEEETTENTSTLWPDAFQRNNEDFSFPATLTEAENSAKGKWWEKIENDRLTEEEQVAAVDFLSTIIKTDDSNEVKADQIKRFISETLFPELPPMSTFTPRGKINLEELETTSNIKLNGREMKETINIAIILDASGSMKNVRGGKTLMEIAKESIQDFASNLPDHAHISLTIYGHKGTGSDQDKHLSCSGIEEIYPLSAYNDNDFSAKLNSIVPSGWTSMAASLEQVGEKLASENSANATNVIYLVSDGKETCDGNPVEAAKKLTQSNINPIINVIGLAVQAEDAKELKRIADNAKGRYISVQNQQDLDKEFQESGNTIEQWMDWHKQNKDQAIDQLMEDKTRLMELNEQTVDRLMMFHRHGKQVLMDLKRNHNLESDIYQEVFSDLEDFYNAMYKQKDELYRGKFNQIGETYNETTSEIDESYNSK